MSTHRIETEAFLLTRSWRDRGDRLELEFWASSAEGPLRILVHGQEPTCFLPRDTPRLDLPLPHHRSEVNLKSLSGREVDALYFRSQRDLRKARTLLKEKDLRLYESDLKPSDRFLMERFLRGAIHVAGEASLRRGWLELENPILKPGSEPRALKACSLDIETNIHDNSLLSIALTHQNGAQVFLLEHGDWEQAPRATSKLKLTVHPTEASLLRAFQDGLQTLDPDLILGWNVVDFDLATLQRRCEELQVPFSLGRGPGKAAILPPPEGRRAHLARLPGRVVLDGIQVLISAAHHQEDYSLQAVSKLILGHGKLLHEETNQAEEILRLHREEPERLVEYNVEDCRLVEGIFERLHLVDYLVERATLTGLELDRAGGSIAAFDNLYLPRLHREGHVAPDVDSLSPGQGSPGGQVFDSVPGLHDNVLLLDFKSLYPSIIRTFLIDPLGLAVPGSDPVPGFLSATFNRERHILPGLITEMWAARDAAKSREDAMASQAIKILMNSLYGVLGASTCRFADPRLASSITKRGHAILETSRDWLEEEGLQVIYGDTDSLFVLLGPDRTRADCLAQGTALAAELTARWKTKLSDELNLDSQLEMEFETHFSRFHMPTMRHSTKGTKKRYAGLVEEDDGTTRIVFKGLEVVRSDWTPLAREIQRELYTRVFHEEPWEDWLKSVASELRAGQLDEKLVYRKRLRRSLADYAEKGAPPHVQAARLLPRVGRHVRYVMTVAGPAPAESPGARLDHEHYLKRQVAPAVDGLLTFLDTSLAELLDPQMGLFD